MGHKVSTFHEYMPYDKIQWKYIDKSLRPLVKAMNEVGMETIACCDGDGGKYAYIAFKLDGVHGKEEYNLCWKCRWAAQK